MAYPIKKEFIVMRKIILYSILLLTAVLYAQDKEDMQMKYNKVIYEASDEKAKEIFFQPDSIAGLWQIQGESNYEYFDMGRKSYCLIINADEKSGAALFFSVTSESAKIIKKIPVTIERTGVGTYVMKNGKKKRTFKVRYTAYDGIMYLYYDDSSPYNKEESWAYDGSLFSRDSSEKGIQKLFQQYIDNENIDYPQE